jgi:hypothetical protein
VTKQLTLLAPRCRRQAMPNLDIYTFASSMTLLMPLAGRGRSFRFYAPRYCPLSCRPRLAAMGFRCAGEWNPRAC